MSRIRTKFVKTTTRKIWRENLDSFTKDFVENKKILGGIAELSSKKIRNMIAGYLTSLKKREGKERVRQQESPAFQEPPV